MSLTGKQKKYLRKNIKTEGIKAIADHLGVPEKEIESYLQKIWRPSKYQRIVKSSKRNSSKSLRSKIKKFNFSAWIKNHRWEILGLLFLIFIVYANSVNNEFLSDDISTIVENKDLGNVSFISRSFPVYLRPIFYSLINKLFGKIPQPFRILNIAFHCGSTLLVFLLLSILIKPLTGLIAAVIFAVHPLLIESVAWISGGLYCQYTFFILLGLILFLLSQKNKKLYWCSMIAFLLSLASSEKAMTFPLLLLLLVVTYPDNFKNKKRFIAPFVLGLTWIGFYMTKIPQRLTALQTQHYQEKTSINLFRLIPISLASYLKLIFWPKNLSFYHSEASFTTLEYIICLIVFFSLSGIIAYSFFKKKKEIFFFLSLFVISLAPVLTPFGISWWLAERYVYLGSIGIFAVVAIGLEKIISHKKLKPLGVIILGLIVIALSARTIIRNRDWKNQDTLWIASAKTSPSSPQNHNNLGDMYSRHGDFEKAVDEFKRATELKPNYADAYHNLANTYQQMGKSDEALKNYQKAIKINPNLWQSYQNSARIYFDRQEYPAAETALKEALKINSQNLTIYSNLAILYLRTNQQDKAKKILQEALNIDPKNPKIIELLNQLNSSNP